MAQYFQGAIKSGDGASEVATGVGTAVMTQTQLVNFTAEAGGGSDNVDFTFVLPKSAQIMEYYVDTLTAWNSVTSAGLTLGSTAGGTEYMTSVDVKSDGREAATKTAAQLAAMDDIGTNTTVYGRVAQVGNTSAGQARVTLVYTSTL